MKSMKSTITKLVKLSIGKNKKYNFYKKNIKKVFTEWKIVQLLLPEIVFAGTFGF